MEFQKPGRWLACGVLALAVLVACGGGDSPFASGPMQVQGTVLDAQAAGSRVFLDLNNNQAWDAGEPASGPVAADGTFQMQIGAPSNAQLATAMFVVDAPGFQALAPAAAFVSTDSLGRQRTSHVVISPLTTLVGAEVAWNNVTPAEGARSVQQQLGLGSADPLSDYAATRDSALQAQAGRAAAQLAALHVRGTPAGESPMQQVVRITRAFGNPQAAAFAPQDAEVEGANQRFIVQLRDDVADPTARGDRTAAAHGGTVGHVFSRVMKGFALSVPGANVAQLLADLQQDPAVLHVEADRPVKALTIQANPTWGLDRTDQRYLELDHMYRYTGNGSGVRAYVVDTGIRSTHAELKPRVLAGYSAISDGNGTNDCHGHGTHVSGTIGGTTWGMAKGVSLVPVRVLDCGGSGSVSGVIAGLDWVAANAVKPAVVNMSLGGGASDLLDAAVGRVVDAGVTVVVAAGNSADNACNYSPARASAAFAVAASDSGDLRAWFSNTGTCVSVFAPGLSITSAGIASDTASATMSGTSMASPHVAGLAALYLATHTTAAPAEVTGAITASATLDQIADAGAGTPASLIYTDLASPSPDPLPGISAPISAPPLPAPSISVGALSGSSAVVRRAWQAKATITVQNQLGTLVPNATVTGLFSNSTRAVSCRTGTNGTCAIAASSLPMTLASVQFSVTKLTLTGYPYNAANNAATSVMINRPI